MKVKNSLLTLFCAFAFLTLGACNHSAPSKQNTVADSGAIKQTTPEIGLTANKLSEKAKKLTDVANFIAGMPTDSSSFMYKYSLTPAWKTYFEESTTAWGKFKILSDKIAEWRKTELPTASDPIETLFYPFGGPDYLFANIFFPNAKNYILIGLESPGSVPQIDSSNKDSLKRIMNLYKKAIEDVIQLSFFRTIDMKSDLTSKAIDGTAPIIMLFLARSGKEILDVIPMNLNENGKLIAVTGNNKHSAIQIDFRNPGDSIVRHIYYLSTNLADPSLSKNKAFLAYLNNIDPKSTSFVKSATYLMHKSYFSIIRNTVLDKSIMVLQDDSGIGYKFFDKSKWNITLYGTYTKPIPLFKEHYEPELFDAYKNINKPLDFRYGYNAKSNLLLATKK